MREQSLTDQIQKLKENLDIEKLVSAKIQEFIAKRKKDIEAQNAHRENMRETGCADIAKKKE